MSLKTDIDQLVADAAIMHDIVQGPAALVTTENGQVKSLAMVMELTESLVVAIKWVSGTTYAQGDSVWSPLNYLSYRRKVAGAGTTDPSADTTNWAAIGGQMMSGSVTLNGVGGVTITHNKGDTKYLLKLMPTGAAPGDAGDISYVKAANTCTVYNTGRPRIVADYELSTTP